MIEKLARKNIVNLKPYSSARDEFMGEASVFLDANENPYNHPFNRYPDPLAGRLRQKIAELKGLEPEQVFTGNGSDEAIDLLIRIFCEPGIDNILSLDPTYGMYEVCASINNVRFIKIRLTGDFQPDLPVIFQDVDPFTKLIFLCSPNNPTGNSFDQDKMLRLINDFPGITVLDEAYIDFSIHDGYLNSLSGHPRLVILQTLSKAWGLAGIRLGMVFGHPEVIRLLNKVKYPYNINLLTQQKALETLNHPELREKWVEKIISGRMKLENELLRLPFIQKIYPSDSNFLLVKVEEPKKVYDFLMRKGIIVRDRSSATLCEGCLRITAGTEEENERLIEAIQLFNPHNN